MAEPEDVLLDGAHHATLFAQRLWRRHAGTPEPDVLRLADVRGRLELFVRAAFGEALTLGVAEPPPLPSWFARLGKRIPRHLVRRAALTTTDGTHVRLPRSLRGADGAALTTYRLLASEAAARAARGTPHHLPDDPLARDLYLVREAAAAEAVLAGVLPGLLEALLAARAGALARRPDPGVLTPLEAAVEGEVRATLRASPDALALPHPDSPEVSRAWAEAEAARLRAIHPGRYRGLPPVDLWGHVTAPADTPRRTVQPPGDLDTPAPLPRVARMQRRPQVRHAPEDEDDDRAGLWMIQLDDPQEHVEDPMGLQRPSDRDDEADPDDLADSLSELPEARLVDAPGTPREVLAGDEPLPKSSVAEARAAAGPGLAYPEWDYKAAAYRPHGAVVRERTPPPGDAAWAEAVLARRAVLLHEVRRRFERLRPRRLRLRRQRDGTEIDLDAYVAAHADRRAGCPDDERLYEAVRPARRDVAIALLVDVSGSTDAWVTDDLRVIDVEKEALVVVCDALDALGDPYTILAFSGEGPESVSLSSLKSFDERAGRLVYRRIAALEPDRYTRMGAAIRHATARLMTRPARHRLLLVLSDGKPNDVDRYEGRYGIEDARQAVAEARLQGLHPFCVTVDRHAPAYMPRIFGSGGYAALHHPEHLPTVLVDVLRRLVRG